MGMIFIPQPTLKCSQCGSLNIARLVRENGRLICVDCGHKGPPIPSPMDREMGSENETTQWVAKERAGLEEF